MVRLPKKCREILTPADVEGHTLLASETRAGDWADWLEAAGLTPLPDIRVTRTGYVAIIPRQADAGNLFADFVDWLVGEARGSAGS